MTRTLAFTWIAACWLAPACAESFAAQGHHRRAVEIAAAKSPVPHDDHVDPPSTTSVGPGAAVPTLPPTDGARKPAATHTSASHAAAQRDRASSVGAFPDDALQSARACWVEAGWSLLDCRSIVWVIKRRAKRAGWSYARMLLKYSALDADNERAAFARQLPAGDELTWSARENERWALLRAVARGALDGRLRSAAPGATHWGSRTLAPDRARAKRAIDAGRWRTVPAPTVNAFYAERGR